MRKKNFSLNKKLPKQKFGFFSNKTSQITDICCVSARPTFIDYFIQKSRSTSWFYPSCIFLCAENAIFLYGSRLLYFIYCAIFCAPNKILCRASCFRIFFHRTFCGGCSYRIGRLVNSHAVDMIAARPYDFKTILWETLFLDQLHDFSLLSLNSLLYPFFRSKFMRKNSMTPEKFHFWSPIFINQDLYHL